MSAKPRLVAKRVKAGDQYTLTIPSDWLVTKANIDQTARLNATITLLEDLVAREFSLYPEASGGQSRES